MANIFDIKNYMDYLVIQERDNHQDLELHKRFQEKYFGSNFLVKKVINIEKYYSNLEKAFPKSESIKEAKTLLYSKLKGLEKKLE